MGPRPGIEKVLIAKWKTSDGSLFNTERQASEHELAHQQQKAEAQSYSGELCSPEMGQDLRLGADKEALAKKQQEDYETLHEQVVQLYMVNGWSSDHCNCDKFDYSEKCLVVDDRGNHHLCTCKAGICKRHTNRYFKNTGCYWCAHTDCSAHGC